MLAARMGLAIDDGKCIERGGVGVGVGGGGGGDVNIVCGARDLLAAASCSRKEKESPIKKNLPTPPLGRLRASCDLCTKRKRKCSGQKPCSECAIMETCFASPQDEMQPGVAEGGGGSFAPPLVRSGIHDASQLAESRDPNFCCVYSPRLKSGRKRAREKRYGLAFQELTRLCPFLDPSAVGRDAHTDVVPCERINPSRRSTGCQTVDTAAGIMVQIKAETGGPAAAEHDVAGEFEEGSQLPPVAAAVFKGDLSASRDSKVHVKAKDGEPSTEPAAGLTYAERYVAVSLDEATRRLRRVQQALSTDVIELRKRREKDYKRLRAELYSEKARDDPDAYFIEYLETQLQDARRALSAPPEGSLDVSPTPSIGLEDTLGVIKNLEILSTRLSSPVPRT
eukprot:jgi/Undpi1/14055/HiC_scaffold_9.g03706.m1